MKILDQSVEMVRVVHELSGKVAQNNRDLAQQMTRAATSSALNASEGASREGREAAVSVGRCCELGAKTRMALRLARACKYLSETEADAAALDVESVIRVLRVLAYRR